MSQQPYYGNLNLKEKYKSAAVRAWFRENKHLDQPLPSGTVSEYHYLKFFENNPAVRDEPGRVQFIEYLRSQPNVISRLEREQSSSTSTVNTSTSTVGSSSGMFSTPFPTRPFTQPLSALMSPRGETTDAAGQIQNLLLHREYLKDVLKRFETISGTQIYQGSDAKFVLDWLNLNGTRQFLTEQGFITRNDKPFPNNVDVATLRGKAVFDAYYQPVQQPVQQQSAPPRSTTFATGFGSSLQETLDSWKDGKDPKLLEEIATWLKEDVDGVSRGTMIVDKGKNVLVRTGWDYYEKNKSAFYKWKYRNVPQIPEAIKFIKENTKLMPRDQKLLTPAEAGKYLIGIYDVLTQEGYDWWMERQPKLDESRLTGEMSAGPTPDISMIEEVKEEESKADISMEDIKGYFNRPPSRTPPTPPELDDIERALRFVVRLYKSTYSIRRNPNAKKLWDERMENVDTFDVLAITFGHPKVLAKLLGLALPERAKQGINKETVRLFGEWIRTDGDQGFLTYQQIMFAIIEGKYSKMFNDDSGIQWLSTATNDRDQTIEEEFDNWLNRSQPSDITGESQITSEQVGNVMDDSDPSLGNDNVIQLPFHVDLLDMNSPIIIATFTKDELFMFVKHLLGQF